MTAGYDRGDLMVRSDGGIRWRDMTEAYDDVAIRCAPARHPPAWRDRSAARCRAGRARRSAWLRIGLAGGKPVSNAACSRLASACVLATQRIRVGIGIVNPYMRHPAHDRDGVRARWMNSPREERSSASGPGSVRRSSAWDIAIAPWPPWTMRSISCAHCSAARRSTMQARCFPPTTLRCGSGRRGRRCRSTWRRWAIAASHCAAGSRTG